VVGHRLGQYKIVRKLGWARASSVWLCVDTAAPHKTYVAVKILSAHATGCIVGGLSAEYDVFRRIKSANPRHPGFAHCLAVQHCFTVHSSAGGHICFATDVLGPNMMTLRSAQPNQTFPVSVAKRIIKQILLSVDYLHRECGYVHTDIKADNVLASLPDPIVPQIDNHNLLLALTLTCVISGFGSLTMVKPPLLTSTTMINAKPPLFAHQRLRLVTHGQLPLTSGQWDVSSLSSSLIFTFSANKAPILLVYTCRVWLSTSDRSLRGFSKHAVVGLNISMKMVHFSGSPILCQPTLKKSSTALVPCKQMTYQV